VVRLSALARVRGAEGTAYWDIQLLGPKIHEPTAVPVRERVARANLKTVLEVGVAAFDAAVGDILADRDRTHARLSLAKRA
jgi:hypothetical protein